MDLSVVAIASLTLSTVAVLCAVAALLRTANTAKSVARLSVTAQPSVGDSTLKHELSGHIDAIDQRFEVLDQQFDGLHRMLSELRHAKRDALASTSVLPVPPVQAARAVQDGTSERTLIDEEVGKSAQRIATPPTTIESSDVPSALSADSPLRDSETIIVGEVDELIAGYRAKIGERSKAPIREWLSQNNSIMLEVTEDGTLIPSDSGLIAAVPLNDGTFLLVPTAGFVVDFATRFAGNQVSLRQVMRNTFEATVDNSGDMKLQAPAMARREGERWIVVKPGKLSGFTDG